MKTQQGILLFNTPPPLPVPPKWFIAILFAKVLSEILAQDIFLIWSYNDTAVSECFHFSVFPAVFFSAYF